MKTRIEDVLEPIKGIDNITLKKGTDEPLIYIPIDKSYIEILGHKVEVGEGGFKSFGEFVEWLEHIKDVEEENKRLKKEIDDYENKRAYLIDYLSDKIEEAKLERMHVDGMTFLSMREQIYTKVLDIVEEKEIENDRQTS